MFKKSTKRALLMSMVSFILCVSMLVGTTYAWFTDSVTSGNNRIVAGSLDVDLLVKGGNTGYTEYTSIENDQKAIFNYDLWEPGYTLWTNAKVVNKGTLALKYTLRFHSTADIAAEKLAEVIDVYYAASEVEKPNTREIPTSLTLLGTLKNVFAQGAGVVMNDYILAGNESADSTDYATIVLKMKEEAGNEYQGLSISAFDIQLIATQYTYENDSFDNLYDESAHAHKYNIRNDGAWICNGLGVCNQPVYLNTDSAYVMVLGENGFAAPTTAIPLTSAYAADLAAAGITIDGDNVTYLNTGAAQNVVIRTDSFATKLTINGSDMDEVSHYGYAGLVDVQRVGMDSYLEYGTIGRMTVAAGHVAIKENATVYQIVASSGTASAVSVAANADVYEKDGTKVTEVIEKSTVKFTQDAQIGCEHSISHIVIDGTHMYEVCDCCGYTLITVITGSDRAKKTVTDGTNNVITPIQTYLSSNVIEDGHNGDVRIVQDAEPEVATPVIDSSTFDPSCKHTSWTFTSVDENDHSARCDACGLTYTESHQFSGKYCTKCEYEKWERLYWADIEAEMTSVPEGYSEEGDTVYISTNYGFGWFAKQSIAGTNYAGKTVKLTEDIDLLDYYWTPVTGFKGTFDGQNYTISNVYVQGESNGSKYGLFGNCSSAISLKNVNLQNVHVFGNSAVGGLVGETNATIDNVHISGHLEIGSLTHNESEPGYNSSYIGGIVGHGYAKVSNASVVGDATSFIAGGRQVGGIFGYSSEGHRVIADNCSVSNILISGRNGVGGVVGWAHYDNCVNNCSVQNVIVNGTEPDKIGFITGTTNAEDANIYMEFDNNTVTSSQLYLNDVLTAENASMRTMFASYGFGAYYAVKNNHYVFFANETKAQNFMAANEGYELLTTTLSGLIASAEDGETIVLDGNITENRIELIEQQTPKTVTIDLNGYTVTVTGTDCFLVKTGKLIVKDSVGTGRVNHIGTDDLVWLQNNGTLQIDSGSYSFASQYGIAYGGENVIINGGDFTFAPGANNKYETKIKTYVTSGSTVIINGVSYTAE